MLSFCSTAAAQRLFQRRAKAMLASSGKVAVPGYKHAIKIYYLFRRRASAVPEWKILARHGAGTTTQNDSKPAKSTQNHPKLTKNVIFTN